MSPIDILVAHERELIAERAVVIAQAIAHADAGQRVPDSVLDRIGMLDARIGSLIELQLTLEVRS